MDIECHSWDHVHPELEHVAQQNQIKGNFSQINTFIDAQFQFTKAGEYIGEILNGKRSTLFTYPYGEFSDNVVNVFLPKFRSRHQFTAVFTTEPKAVSKTDNFWLLPRYVCGLDWKSPQELNEILINAQNGPTEWTLSIKKFLRSFVTGFWK